MAKLGTKNIGENKISSHNLHTKVTKTSLIKCSNLVRFWAEDGTGVQQKYSEF
jgi:hypothetical protein